MATDSFFFFLYLLWIISQNSQGTDCWCVISILCHTACGMRKALAVSNSVTCLYNRAGEERAWTEAVSTPSPCQTADLEQIP